MDFKSSLRWTLTGMLTLGTLFGSVALWRSVSSGADPVSQLGPIGAVTLLGATVGMLLGPLLGGAARRLHGRRGGET